MSIRKKLASYFLAGIVSLSTLGTTLMSMPAYASGASGNSGSALAKGPVEFGMSDGTTPMIAVYLAGTNGGILSDDDSICDKDEARAIIEGAGNGSNDLLRKYRSNAIYVFPEAPNSQAKIATSIDFRDGTPAYNSLDDIKSHRINAYDPGTASVIKELFSRDGLNKITGINGGDIGETLASRMKKLRDKWGYDEAKEWENLIKPLLAKDSTMLAAAEERYNNNKPVTLIFEVYAKTSGNWYISAQTVNSVANASNWSTTACYKASSEGAAYGVWNIFVGNNTYNADKERVSRYGAPVAYPVHNSKYNLQGSNTGYYPYDTGCIGGWCYFSLCSNPDDSSNFTVQANKTVDVKGSSHTSDSATQNAVKGTTIKFNYSSGFSDSKAKTAQEFAKDFLDLVPSGVSTDKTGFLSATFAAITAGARGNLEVVDTGSSKRVTSGTGNPKSSTGVSLNPVNGARTFYVVYENTMRKPEAPDGIAYTWGKPSAKVICVDLTKSEPKVTFASLDVDCFADNIKVTATTDSKTNATTISLKYTNDFNVKEEDPPRVDVQVAKATVADIDKYYYTNYPANYNVGTVDNKANAQLVYTKMNLANSTDPAVASLYAWHWAQENISDNIDEIMGVIKDRNAQLTLDITKPGREKSKKTFTVDNKYDYALGFVTKDSKTSFIVNKDYVTEYDSSVSGTTFTADEAIEASKTSDEGIIKGSIISQLTLGDGTVVTELPSGTVTLSETNGTDLNDTQVREYLLAYSDYAHKYALYEAMVAQGSAEIGKAIKYWTNAAAALYGEACKLMQDAVVAANTLPTGTLANNSLDLEDTTGFTTYYKCEKCSDYHPISHVDGIAMGFGSSVSLAQKDYEATLAKLIGGSEDVAKKAQTRIEELSAALEQIAGWKFKASIPYYTTRVEKLKTRNFTVYTGSTEYTSTGRPRGTTYRSLGTVYVGYIPELNVNTQLSERPNVNGISEVLSSYYDKDSRTSDSYPDDVADFKHDTYRTMFPTYNHNAYRFSTYTYSDRWGRQTYAYSYYSTYTRESDVEDAGEVEVDRNRTFPVNGGYRSSNTVAIANAGGSVPVNSLPQALKQLVLSQINIGSSQAQYGTTANLTKVGGYLGDAIQKSKDATKALASLEANRPYAEIHVTQDLCCDVNNYDSLFKKADVAAYMLSMKWKDQRPFVQANTYLAQVVDRNPLRINFTQLNPNLGNIRLDTVPTDYKTPLAYTMTDAGKSTRPVINYKVDDKTYYVPLIYFQYQAGTAYTDFAAGKTPVNTPSASASSIYTTKLERQYALPKLNVKNTELDTLGYVYEKFGVYTTTWNVDTDNQLQRYLPSTEWVTALSKTNLGSSAATSIDKAARTLAGAPRANTANVASTSSASKADYITISSRPVTGTEEVSDANNTLYEAYYSGTAVKPDTARYFYSSTNSARWKSDTSVVGTYLSSGRNTWNTSTAPYKLESLFHGYTPGNQSSVPTIPTSFEGYDSEGTPVPEGSSASKGIGIYTRDTATEHYKLYPLVKMGCYQGANATELAYTYIIGQKARELNAYVYYELGITGDAQPVVYANAIASSSKANALGDRMTGGKAPVAYSGTGVTVSYAGDMSFTFQSFSLVNKDAEATYQQDWGNKTSETSAHKEWLESLGAQSSTITTADGGTVNAYTLGYVAGSSVSIRNKTGITKEDAWYLTNNETSYMYENTAKSLNEDIELQIVGKELKGIVVSKTFYDIDGKANTAGTYTGTTTQATLTKVKTTAPAVYRALTQMNIGSILEEVFEGNTGGNVSGDANGNVANALRVTGDGSGWYNEYVYCLVLRLESTIMTMQPPTFTDKIPIELGPSTPANKDNYFSDGYGFVAQKYLVKFTGAPSEDAELTGGSLVNSTVWAKDRGTNATNDLIIADVPVTAAN